MQCQVSTAKSAASGPPIYHLVTVCITPLIPQVQTRKTVLFLTYLAIALFLLNYLNKTNSAVTSTMQIRNATHKNK